MSEQREQENPAIDGPTRRITLDRDMAWPLGIILALVVVVAVNVAFIVVAVRGQDAIAPSYVDGNR